MRPIIPPPIILIFYIALAYGIDWLSPFDLLLGEARLPVSIGLAVIGIGIAALGVLEFRKHRTTVNPHTINKATSLVTGGVFRLTRNPMYLGMLLILFGVVAWTQDIASILVLPALIITLNRLQIQPEEAAMRELFGQVYEDYCQRVRRWI